MSEEYTITVKLTPNAYKNSILGWEEDLFGEKTLKAQVTEPPEKGKANKALIKLLSNHFKKPKEAFSIIRGQTNRIKIIKIQ